MAELNTEKKEKLIKWLPIEQKKAPPILSEYGGANKRSRPVGLSTNYSVLLSLSVSFTLSLMFTFRK